MARPLLRVCYPGLHGRRLVLFCRGRASAGRERNRPPYRSADNVPRVAAQSRVLDSYTRPRDDDVRHRRNLSLDAHVP